jgi:dihydropteroate synthase
MKPRRQFELRIHGRKVLLGERTVIMGVVNVTPDSFSDGGLYFEPARAIEHALKLAREGADWIDVGGESTRPGSRPIAVEEELRRVLPVIRGLRQKKPSLTISIDTTKADVAEEAVRAGAAIINDASGLRFDPRIAAVARRFTTPLILMHMRGRPETMQSGPFARSIWRSVREGLARSVARALAAGVPRSQLMIDPGLGFGKTRRQNFEILAHLDRLRTFGVPILIGASRKSFVQAVVAGEGLQPRGAPRTGPWRITARQKATPEGFAAIRGGDTAVAALAVSAGAHIVRVHDVVAALPAVRIADALLSVSRRGKPS